MSGVSASTRTPWSIAIATPAGSPGSSPSLGSGGVIDNEVPFQARQDTRGTGRGDTQEASEDWSVPRRRILDTDPERQSARDRMASRTGTCSSLKFSSEVGLGLGLEGRDVDVVDDLDDVAVGPGLQGLGFEDLDARRDLEHGLVDGCRERRLLLGTQLVPDRADDDEVGVELVGGQADDVLHFEQVVGGDVGDRVLLAVDGPLLEGQVQLLERDLDGVAPIAAAFMRNWGDGGNRMRRPCRSSGWRIGTSAVN